MHSTDVLPSHSTEAYRAAVDLSAHDFRAWYGLGQAYELLKMPYYALYYYRWVRCWCVWPHCQKHMLVVCPELRTLCSRQRQKSRGYSLWL